MTQAPEQFVVPVPQISFVQGLPHFVRLSDIYAAPGVDNFIVTCITDAPCILTMEWELTNPPADPGHNELRGGVTDVGPVTNHTLAVPAGSIVRRVQGTPLEVIFFIKLDSSDTTGRDMRSYTGTLKLRQRPSNFVPVRFYDFGDTPPPPPGGDGGDWNTYAWSQYNPNGQPFPREKYAQLDLLGFNGLEAMPAVRVLSRAPASTGISISIELTYPTPDAAMMLGQVPSLNQTATFDVLVGGTLRERFTWRVPQPGELEAVEGIIRATADSQLIRCVRLIGNPGPNTTFLGPNYYLIDYPRSPLVVP